MDWRFAGMGEEELMDFFARECLFVPDKGTNYGRNHGGFIRMNISSPLGDIKEALDRIYEGCKRRGLAK